MTNTKENGPARDNVRDRAKIARDSVNQLKHQIHRFQASIGRLEKEADKIAKEGDAEGAKSIEPAIRQLREEVSKLESQVASLPDVADALGLAAPPDATPPKISQVVEAAKFDRLEVTAKEAPKVGFVPLSAEWPRTGQIIKDNELVSIETLGKLRAQVNAPSGTPVGNATFRIVAKDVATGDRLVLRNGITNAHGYLSVNLGSMPVERVADVAIVVGTGDDAENNQEYPVTKAALATHRDLNIAHQVVLRPELAAKIKPLVPGDFAAEAPGTIEDPDEADIAISPASFGLNEEHIDGNCCLRPRAEFAARQYHFRQIVRFDDPQLVGRGDNPVQRSEVRAPLPFGNETLGDYSVTGGNLLLGTVNVYRQGWYPVGRGLGELLYSLALAPCEHVNLAFIDWSRTERDTRAESRVEREQFEHELGHDRSISEVVDSVLTEQQSGSSSSGGGGASLDLGIFSIGGGGGTTSSSTSGRRALQASTVQNVSDEVSQRASAARSQRNTVVTTSLQRESERIQTRTVHNHNKNHAMSVQYFQVLSHYTIKTELVEEKPVLLVPYDIDDDLFDDIPSFDKFVLAPNRPITRFLDRHSRLLRRLVSPSYGRAFESLSRLLHCRDVYDIEQPYATFSRWTIKLDKAWRRGISLSIETKSGQSVQLTPRNGGSGNTPIDFVSDPVKTWDIDGIRVSFDPVETARDLAGLASFLGDRIEDLFEQALNHKLKSIEISARTDRSRFVPEPQSFRLAVTQPDVTLSKDNPFVVADVAIPNVDFEGYRGREHRDYCQLKKLIAYIQSQPMRFMRAIWYYEDPDRRALRFDRFAFQGRSLLDSIVNRPVGILGNYVAFELLEGHRLVKLDAPNYVVSSRLVSLPTRGVFAEVFLSCCNATELRDVERFIEPEQACQVRAPEITGVSPASRASRGDTTPTPFSAPLIALQNAPSVPDPVGLAAGLNVLGTPDIFRDLSRGAELLQFINNATKEAFTSTRQHRAAMDSIAGSVLRGIVSANTGIPVSGGGGSTGASSSGASGITASPTGGGVSNPALQALSSELVRRTSPAQVNDHVQTIKRTVDSGLLTKDQGNQLASSMLGGVPSSGLEVLFGAGAQPKRIRKPSTKEQAVKQVTKCRSSTKTSRWKLQRTAVLDRLEQLINDPNLVDQDGLNLCGPAAFLRIWLARDPLAVAELGCALYDDGISSFGGYVVEPSNESLIAEDYDQIKADNEGELSPEADWMIMGSLRDAANLFFNYKGKPDEDIAAATTPAQIAEWMEATNLYAEVRNEGNFFLTKGIDHAKSLKPNTTTDIALLINAHILNQMNVTSGTKKSKKFIAKAFPNHFVVLLSEIKDATSDTLNLTVWTWGSIVSGTIAKETFAANYYGAVIGHGGAP